MVSSNSRELRPNAWKLTFIIFVFSALSPEYIAPVFLVVGAIYTISKAGIHKMNLSSFSIGYSFLIFMGWMVIGAFYSNSIISSLTSILLWTVMLANYWLCTTWVNSEEKLEKIIYGGTIATGVNGFLGIIQHLARVIFGEEAANIINPIWRFFDLLIEKVVAVLPEAISSHFPRTTFMVYDDRSCGSFSNPLFFATFLVAMVPFCFFCFLNGKEKKHRITGLICLILTLGGIASSYSRGPYIVTVLIFILLLIYGGKKAKKVLITGAFSGLSVILIFHNVIARLLTLGSTTDSSINNRKIIWSAMLEKIPERFFFGYGTGYDSVRSILHNEYNLKRSHAHNVILEIHMENGVIGVILFAFACIIFLYNIYKLYKKGGTAKNFAITFFASIAAMGLCGVTDCIFYGLKPLQYFMLILGLTQATVNMFFKDEDVLGDIKKKFISLKKNKSSQNTEENSEETALK